MTRSKREYVRQVKNASFADKRFRPLFKVKKRIDLKKFVHPCVVTEDLRRGAISSLDRYLLKTKGGMDRAVALELRKLISGSIERIKFRLIVVEHPDKPKDKGGRPKAHKPEPSAKAYAIAEELAPLAKPGQVESAVATVAKKRSVHTSVIYKHKAKIKSFRAAEDAQKAEKQKRESDIQALQMRGEAARKVANVRLKKEAE